MYKYKYILIALIRQDDVPVIQKCKDMEEVQNLVKRWKLTRYDCAIIKGGEIFFNGFVQ